jgi:hypothetical protein
MKEPIVINPNARVFSVTISGLPPKNNTQSPYGSGYVVWSNSGPSYEYLLVVAMDFNEAASKANLWIEMNQHVRKHKVTTSDGSLDLSQIETEPQIVSIGYATQEIMF